MRQSVRLLLVSTICHRRRCDPRIAMTNDKVVGSSGSVGRVQRKIRNLIVEQIVLREAASSSCANNNKWTTTTKKTVITTSTRVPTNNNEQHQILNNQKINGFQKKGKWKMNLNNHIYEIKRWMKMIGERNEKKTKS